MRAAVVGHRPEVLYGVAVACNHLGLDHPALAVPAHRMASDVLRNVPEQLR
jgi:hypothetical protein